MSKRSFRGKPKKAKGPKMNPSSMMQQMQQMQQQMAEAQKKLEDESVIVTAGGGAISIEVTGHQRIKSIKLDPELLDPEEVEMLQDMLIAGINSAIEQSQTMAAEKMEGITGNMGGVNDLLGGLGF
ncbi:MAG: YbaB/EbfC family nucleoid-associated protein [Anaerolineales bacterium]|nr:YbaB/EbfC family nucleoid-associated protein [Anaerolineales bacterium]MCA9931319.1 YbaB/EbfC family nucleoid-associated protein [Anaerolineales bacterium]